MRERTRGDARASASAVPAIPLSERRERNAWSERSAQAPGFLQCRPAGMSADAATAGEASRTAGNK
jgi:hypothetical protein